VSALVVIAKECLPGRVKTRLHDEFTREEAAGIASASLAMTLDVGRRLRVDHRILYLDGGAAAIRTAGFDVVTQPSGTLDERLAHLFDMLDEPTLLIGMDTPQVRVSQLRFPDRTDAVIGAADDGGFWALGMREPRGDVIRGIPMSRGDTGAQQRASLAAAGLTIAELDGLRDVDLPADALAVADLLPGSVFARAVAAARRRSSAA
jgi:glycosyltransferase A (GT-A) superfamily protein (DUF2064 family)